MERIKSKFRTIPNESPGKDAVTLSRGGSPGPNHRALGLTQLYPNPEIESISNIKTEVDVIALHGLNGHALTTWTEGDKLWLRDFLPRSCPTARIMTFGYEANMAFTGSRSNIRDFAIGLLEAIMQFRRKKKVDETRKTIFVCHGLGGIVFKQALIIAHEEQIRYGEIGKSVTGVLFLGTPHRGVDWSTMLAKFTKYVLAGNVRQDLLENLAPKSTVLHNICSQFVERGMGLQIFSLYETRETPGLGSLIVDEFSAILHLPNETPLPLHADHWHMCRFLTSSDSNYVTISNCISELIDTLQGGPGKSCT